MTRLTPGKPFWAALTEFPSYKLGVGPWALLAEVVILVMRNYNCVASLHSTTSNRGVFWVQFHSYLFSHGGKGKNDLCLRVKSVL